MTSVGLLLHHGGRYRRRWTWHPHARAGVDYRDGVAGAQSGRLVYFHLLAALRLEAGYGVVRVVGCGGRKGEAGSDLLLRLDLGLGRRGMRRAARKGTIR